MKRRFAVEHHLTIKPSNNKTIQYCFLKLATSPITANITTNIKGGFRDPPKPNRESI